MKKNCVSKALFLAVFVFSTMFLSCGDSGTESLSTKIDITGKISGLLNIPVSNAIIKIGDKTTLTSSNGDFFLQDVTTPYDLRIMDSTLNNKEKFIFKGLSRTNLNFRLPYIPKEYNSTNLYISFPPEVFTSGGKAIFTDGNQISFYGNIEDSNSTCISTYIGNNLSITGKVILIFYTKDNFNNIVSYDRYGEKDNVTINSGITKNVDFTLNDLQLNPEESTVSGSFSGLPGYDNYKFFHLTFGKKYSSGFSLNLSFSEIAGENFSLVIPTNLPSDFTPLIYINKISSNGNIAQQFVLPKSGTGIILNVPQLPALINPPDNAVNVDTTTLFEWTTGSENGIYCIYVSDPSNTYEEYRIYTNSTSTTLADLSRLDLVYFSNRTFFWSCTKYGNVNSLDELLDPARNNLAYFNVSTSSRTFKTK